MVELRENHFKFYHCISNALELASNVFVLVFKSILDIKAAFYL